MIRRYVVGPSDGSNLHGHYHSVSHLWENGDGTSMYRVQCDDAGFDRLNSDNLISVMPSLQAPASRSVKMMGLAAIHGVSPAQGDTVLNVLRSIRDKKGLNVRIDACE